MKKSGFISVVVFLIFGSSLRLKAQQYHPMPVSSAS